MFRLLVGAHSLSVSCFSWRWCVCPTLVSFHRSEVPVLASISYHHNMHAFSSKQCLFLFVMLIHQSSKTMWRLSRSKATFRETNPRVSLHISQPPHNWIQVCILTVYCILTRSCLKFCGTICNLIYILLLWYLVPTSIVVFFWHCFTFPSSWPWALSLQICQVHQRLRLLSDFHQAVLQKSTRSIETHQTIFKRSATRSQTVCKLCHSSAMKSSSFWHSVQKLEMILNYVVFQCGLVSRSF